MKYTDDILIQYLEGSLSDRERDEIENWLKESDEGNERIKQFSELLGSIAESKPLDPDENLDWEFRSMLDEEISQQNQGWGQWTRIAAAVTLLIVGFTLGSLFTDGGSDGNYASLQEQVNDLQQVVMQERLQTHSASQRLQVVNQIETEMVQPNNELITTLIGTLSNDDSPNVRYAAVQALGKFMNYENVRQALVRSLEQQDDPLIQIALINLLVEAEEKSAIAPMKKIIENEETAEEVVRQARIAMDILI